MGPLTTADGVRIDYAVSGAGEPAIVLVHGWCSRAAHWERVAGPLATQHRVVVVDRRGHGRSDVPDGGYTAAQHAADLAEVLRQEGIHDAVVVGHAGAVPCVLELAGHEPNAVSALVLVDGRIGPGSDLEGPRQGPLGELVAHLRGADGAAVLESMYRGFFTDPDGELAERVVADARTVPLAVAAAELASLAVDTEALARRVRRPVLWIAAGPIDDDRLGEAFERLEIGRVVGSGHFPHLEVPDQVVAMLRRFVAVATTP